MVSLGSTVFFICKGKEGKVKLRGTVVDTANQTLVVAIDAPQAGQIANSVLYQKAGEESIGFVRVAASAVSSHGSLWSRRSAWTAARQRKHQWKVGRAPSPLKGN